MNKEIRIKKIGDERGFSLVEIIVSLGILAIVILINLGVVFSVSSAQKKAIALQNAQDNIRYAFEAMTKEIRTGYNFSVSADGKTFTFTNSYFDAGFAGHLDNVSYSLVGTQLVRSGNQYITATNVKITNLSFVVTGQAASDGRQPMVTIIMQGRVDDPKNTGVSGATPAASLNLQTTITQEKLDS